MTADARIRATYDDLLKVDDKLVAELIDGELHSSPRPGPRHADVSSSLGMKLGPPFRFGDGGPGGWWILDEPELHLGRDVLVPDLAGWRRERMPELPTTAWFDIPPDWICEVLSESTTLHDRIRKMPVYAHHGVAYAWLVNPVLQSLEVLRLENGRWLVLSMHAGDEKVSAEPFDAVVLDLADLWAPPK